MRAQRQATDKIARTTVEQLCVPTSTLSIQLSLWRMRKPDRLKGLEERVRRQDLYLLQRRVYIPCSVELRT